MSVTSRTNLILSTFAIEKDTYFPSFHTCILYCAFIDNADNNRNKEKKSLRIGIINNRYTTILY